jgi:biopolymer transport protein TolR
MSDINVTPLVDVMLVLVVIFIITAPLLASSIRLDLPKHRRRQPSDAAEFVTAGGGQGRAGLPDDKPVTQAELAAGAAAAGRQANPDTEGAAARRPRVPYGRWSR